MRTILLPGGIGYIGSHTVLALLPLIRDKPFRILIFDNLSNSSDSILLKLQAIAV
jgi:UDP-glucose 4-epimerase